MKAYTIVLVSGSQGLESLDYVIGCVTEDHATDSAPWQWMLGRLYVLERLFDEFHNELLPRNPPDGKSADEESVTSDSTNSSVIKTSVHDRLLQIAKFCMKAVGNSHMKICRMARRVFFLVARFSAHMDSIVEELREMLNNLETSYSVSMRKRLDKIVDEFMLSERIVQELQHGTHHRLLQEKGLPPESPARSPTSSPRCNSPVTSDAHSDVLSIPGRHMPLAPPNTPIRCRRKCQFDKKDEGDVLEDDQQDILDEDEVFAISVKAINDKVQEISQTQRISPSPLTEGAGQKRTPPPIPPRPSSRRGSYEILQMGPILSPPVPPPPDVIMPRPDLINSCDIRNNNAVMAFEEVAVENKGADRTKMSLPVGDKLETEHSNKEISKKGERKTSDMFRFPPPPVQAQNSEDSAICLCDSECSDTSQYKPCPKHHSCEWEGDAKRNSHYSQCGASTSLSSDERTLSSDDSLDRIRRKTRKKVVFPSAEQGATSSDEILDLSVRSVKSEDSFVTFKTEVATMTPKDSPNSSMMVQHGKGL